MKYTFRFDDVSINTDENKLDRMLRFLRSTFKPSDLGIMLAVSPAVVDMRGCEKRLDQERIFPAIWHTQSDHRIFYRMEKVGVPDWIRQPGVELAAHGMVHVDHRLLKRSAQELSILMSCSLVNCKIFVPPFHKWNAHTEAICAEHEIVLVKYDTSWRHLAFHPFDHRTSNYYLHTHDFDYQSFCARFPAENFGHPIPR